MRGFFILALLFVCLSGTCQTYRIDDSFDDNHLNWWEGELDGGSQSIADGKLLMQFPENGWTVSVSPYLVFEKDFEAQVSLKQINGDDNLGFGMVWGYDRKINDYNYFLISSSGYFLVSPSAAEIERTKSDRKTWTSTPVIKPLGETNILKIEQRQGTVTFFINEQKVFSTPTFRWIGLEIGFTAIGRAKVEADDFHFVQEGLKINQPPNLTRGLRKENLGPNINTVADDLIPRISVDGKTLYFGREHFVGNMGGEADEEDFYVSNFDQGRGGWSQAENLGAPVNSNSVDNISSVSVDNNSFVFVSDDKFWIRKRSVTGWAEPIEVGINFKNEAKYMEACLSSDGKAMLIALMNADNISYRPEVDERDLYVSLIDQDGKWSSPINLGRDVNTDRDEVSPFLAADGRTLYFASDGRPGYGGVDIYMTKRLGEGWTNWSEPLNLGPEINTNTFDAYCVLPASGEFAYIVSDTDGFGKSDIVRIKLPNELKPDPVMLVKGRTLDSKTNKPISATIHIDNLKTSLEVGQAISHPATGEFTSILQYGAAYSIHAKADGYIPISENLKPIETGIYQELKKDVYLTPIEVGQSIQLNNVFFERGLATLKPESYLELERLVKMMSDRPTMEVELEGHTDDRGKKSELIKLSKDRVAAVKEFLMNKGIASNRINGRGYGPARPRVKNDTDEHREMNRRVEFRVVKM